MRSFVILEPVHRFKIMAMNLENVASRTIADRETKRVFLGWRAFADEQRAVRWQSWVRCRRIAIEVHLALRRQIQVVNEIRYFRRSMLRDSFIAWVIVCSDYDIGLTLTPRGMPGRMV